MDYSNLFVCLMGICTVFIGLICIIILVSLMSNVVRRTEQSGKKQAAAQSSAPAPASSAPAASAGTGAVTAEMVAAVSAAIAEDMGTDVSAIRIVSFRRLQA